MYYNITALIIFIITFSMFKIVISNFFRMLLTYLIFVLSSFAYKEKYLLRFIIMGFLVAGGESLFIINLKNAWTYKSPQVLQVPIWLPALWTLALLVSSNTLKNYPIRDFINKVLKKYSTHMR